MVKYDENLNETKVVEDKVIGSKNEDEINETEVQLVPPIVMVAPDTKSDPVSVTEVPPAVVPKVGVMLLKVGGTA